MNTIRFFYNPDKKKIIDCGYNSHSQTFTNKRMKNFDFFIRGLINNKTLFLRVYSPYDDAYNPLPYDKLLRQSKALLKSYSKDIIKELKKEGYSINKIAYNATNESLKNSLNTSFV